MHEKRAQDQNEGRPKDAGRQCNVLKETERYMYGISGDGGYVEAQ